MPVIYRAETLEDIAKHFDKCAAAAHKAANKATDNIMGERLLQEERTWRDAAYFLRHTSIYLKKEGNKNDK